MKRVKIMIWDNEDGTWHLHVEVRVLGFFSVATVDTNCATQEECMEHAMKIVGLMRED